LNVWYFEQNSAAEDHVHYTVFHKCSSHFTIAVILVNIAQ